jgi:hypothetical protein
MVSRPIGAVGRMHTSVPQCHVAGEAHEYTRSRTPIERPAETLAVQLETSHVREDTMKIYVAPVLASFGKVTNQTESAF